MLKMRQLSKFNLTPSKITLYLLGASLIPRLLSSFALDHGTVYIVLMSLPFLIFLPEMADDYESKIEAKKLSKFTFICLLVSVISILLSLVYKNQIYQEGNSLLLANIRRSLYLIQPLIYLAWYPKLKKNNQMFFLLALVLLTLLMFLALTFHKFLRGLPINDLINNFTASFSALISSIVIRDPVEINGSSFGSSSFMIEVGDGCSPIRDAALSFYSIIVLYLCCKMKSKLRLATIVLITFVITFLINSIRISILAFVVSKNQMAYFDFFAHWWRITIFFILHNFRLLF